MFTEEDYRRWDRCSRNTFSGAEASGAPKKTYGRGEGGIWMPDGGKTSRYRFECPHPGLFRPVLWLSAPSETVDVGYAAHFPLFPLDLTFRHLDHICPPLFFPALLSTLPL